MTRRWRFSATARYLVAALLAAQSCLIGARASSRPERPGAAGPTPRVSVPGRPETFARFESVTPSPNITWTQQAEVTATDGAPFDIFGGAVAIDGSTAVVGAYGNDRNRGAVYVYVRGNTGWSRQAELTASDAALSDYFGHQIALSGNTLVVGVPSKNGTGVVYVFARNGQSWQQQAEFAAADSVAGDGFGGSVALQGTLLAVGAAGKNGGRGAAYVFVRSGSTWSQQAELTASDIRPGDGFGPVVLSGTTLAVGAMQRNTGRGAVYVFVGSGQTWSQQAEITAADGAPYDHLGFAIALYGDTLVAGAPTRTAHGVAEAGTVYAFQRSGNVWTLQAELTAAHGVQNDRFGWALALDGATALVAAPDRNLLTGIVYVLVHGSSGWRTQAELSAGDAHELDQFGSAVALSGTTAVIGAPYKGNWRGAGYVFGRTPSGLTS